MQASNKGVFRQHKIRYNRWLVAAAYVAVIIIWSTTPLTIKWSSEGVSYLFGILARMSVGAIVAVCLSIIYYKKLPINRTVIKAYFSVALAVFGGMLPVYWGAQYISSGLISVIFGVTPMITGYLAWRFIHEHSFSGVKIWGGLMGVSGLAVIFIDDSSPVENYLYGVAAILLAVLLHSISAVWVKSIKVEIPAVSLVAGGLLFSMPLFVAVYLIFAPPLPDIIPQKAIWSIVYLGVVGSVVGFVCYYFLLKQLPASTVALITLITPVTALLIGNILNNESISVSIYIGAGFVILGLALHQWGEVLLEKVWRKRNVFYG